MTARDRVIYDIERCICHVPDACKDCSHYQKGEAAIDCMEILLADALALLREQEPVEPKVEVDVWVCGNCGTPLEQQSMVGENAVLAEQFDYCHHCGRAVKWE